jgi:hypothetical protein
MPSLPRNANGKVLKHSPAGWNLLMPITKLLGEKEV